ncbi:MAG: polyphenol oxidase family protein [Acidimicrobiales bacterium]
MLSWTIPLVGRRVEVRSTTVHDGDFAIPPVQLDHNGRPLPQVDPDDLRQRRSNIMDAPWTWLRQVHGTDLVVVAEPGAGAGAVADGAITTASGVPIAVTTADCSPVVLISTAGVAVVHAGWRGARSGIIETAGRRLLAEGGRPVSAVLGPCIAAPRYEFGGDDLASMVEAYGPDVAALTDEGTPALDMAEVIAAACANSGWGRPDPVACTSAPDFFSHRVRGDRGRQTTVAWIEEDPA